MSSNYITEFSILLKLANDLGNANRQIEIYRSKLKDQPTLVQPVTPVTSVESTTPSTEQKVTQEQIINEEPQSESEGPPPAPMFDPSKMPPVHKQNKEQTKKVIQKEDASNTTVTQTNLLDQIQRLRKADPSHTRGKSEPIEDNSVLNVIAREMKNRRLFIDKNKEEEEENEEEEVDWNDITGKAYKKAFCGQMGSRNYHRSRVTKGHPVHRSVTSHSQKGNRSTRLSKLMHIMSQ